VATENVAIKYNFKTSARQNKIKNMIDTLKVIKHYSSRSLIKKITICINRGWFSGFNRTGWKIGNARPVSCSRFRGKHWTGCPVIYH